MKKFPCLSGESMPDAGDHVHPNSKPVLAEAVEEKPLPHRSLRGKNKSRRKAEHTFSF
jgi:hypothetical protein